MNIILNEKAYIEDMINKGKVNTMKPSSTVVLLAKHYNILGYDQEEMIEAIDCFMTKHYEAYSVVTWRSLVEKITKKAIEENKNYFLVKEIKITESEWEYIRGLPKEKNQKLMFTYLIYAKILNKKNSNNNNWVSDKYRNEIFLEANVSDRGLNQLKTLHELLKAQVIYVPNDYMKNSINVGNIINEEDEVKLTITDFRDLGLQYMLLIGNKKIGKCEDCGKHFKKKSVNSNQKRCSSCAKKQANKQKLESKKRKK